MRTSARWTTIALGVGFGAAVSMNLAAAPDQSPQTLAALTVPTERLPEGCRLEPVNADATGVTRFVMAPGIRENPWVGTSRPYAASIRLVVDGPAGPTYGLPSGPAQRDRLAEDVVAAYRARYVAANGEKVEVWAIRFNDPALTLAASLNRLQSDPPERPRIVFGATAVLAYLTWDGFYAKVGNAGEACLRAVRDHISSLE